MDVGCTVLHSFHDKPAKRESFDAAGIEYYKNGKLHRDNGKPAKVNCFKKEWYKHGKLHREKFPARITHTDEQSWFVNGECIQILHEHFSDINYCGELDDSDDDILYDMIYDD